MKKVRTLCTVLVCLALATSAAFSQQPTSPQNPPQQNFQQPKADVSKDAPAEGAGGDGQTHGCARDDLLHGRGEWRGVREQAIENINQAIANLNKSSTTAHRTCRGNKPQRTLGSNRDLPRFDCLSARAIPATRDQGVVGPYV